MYFNQSGEAWRISQCCQFHDKTLAKRYNFGTTTKTYALKEGGKERVQSKALENCRKLADVLESYFPTQPIHLRSFRISSGLFPCILWTSLKNGTQKFGTKLNQSFLEREIGHVKTKYVLVSILVNILFLLLISQTQLKTLLKTQSIMHYMVA